jgi:hypothetical protein
MQPKPATATPASSKHATQDVRALLAHPQLFRIGDIGNCGNYGNFGNSGSYGGSGMQERDRAVASGWPALDAELIGQGWPRPGLTEILCDHVGVGEVSLLLKALRAGSLPPANGEAPHLLWVMPVGQPWIPYAPGLVQAGIHLEHLAIVRPRSTVEALWAAEQGLKSKACRGALLWLGGGYCSPLSLRRLLQSAISGEAMAWVIRPLAAATSPSPAGLRIALHPQANGELRLDLLKRRGLPPGKAITLTPRALACVSRSARETRAARLAQGARRPAEWLQSLLSSKSPAAQLVRERPLHSER